MLNPSFNQWATAPNRPRRLLIPVEKMIEFRANLANIPKKDRMTWIRYMVKSGDNLRAINIIEDVNKIHLTLICVGQEFRS